MKMSIQWHKEALKRNKEFLKIRLHSAVNDIKSLERSIQAYFFYRKQINEAVKQKKDGFDSEKFLIKRRNKNANSP